MISRIASQQLGCGFDSQLLPTVSMWVWVSSGYPWAALALFRSVIFLPMQVLLLSKAKQQMMQMCKANRHKQPLIRHRSRNWMHQLVFPVIYFTADHKAAAEMAFHFVYIILISRTVFLIINWPPLCGDAILLKYGAFQAERVTKPIRKVQLFVEQGHPPLSWCRWMMTLSMRSIIKLSGTPSLLTVHR